MTFSSLNNKKKHIIFKTEPVGRIAPKVSLADELTVARVRLGESLSLVCPVQSFPVSLFR